MEKSNYHPIAYFITIRAYGTWLHGDKRFSMNRIQNRYGSEKIKRNGHFENLMKNELKDLPMYFDDKKRDIIRNALQNTCHRYQWKLYALHIRTNHAHIVLQSDNKVNEVMQALKANATLLLRKQGEIERGRKVWSHHGSTKYIWTECALHYVCKYTINEQGEKMDYINNVEL